VGFLVSGRDRAQARVATPLAASAYRPRLVLNRLTLLTDQRVRSGGGPPDSRLSAPLSPAWLTREFGMLICSVLFDAASYAMDGLGSSVRPEEQSVTIRSLTLDAGPQEVR